MPVQESEIFSKFVQLFNEAKYFESHEILEELWRKSSGKKKRFYQGLIQAAVALHHAKNRNWRGAQNEYQLSMQKLKGLPSNYLGVSMEKFREDLASCFGSNDRAKTYHTGD